MGTNLSVVGPAGPHDPIEGQGREQRVLARIRDILALVPLEPIYLDEAAHVEAALIYYAQQRGNQHQHSFPCWLGRCGL